MITKFNEYNKINESVSYDLVSQFSDKFIDDFYQEHMYRNAQEIIEEIWPSLIWKYIDNERYMETLKEEEKSNLDIEYFGEYEYKKYLEDHMTDDIEEIILNLYNEKNNEKEEDYNSYMLSYLSEEQLREIIEDECDHYDFMEFAVEDKYEDRDAEDVAREIYNMDDGADLYKAFGYYVDDEALEKEYNKEDVNKMDEIQDQISNYTELQEELLKIDKSNILLLAELLKNNGRYDNIGNTFEFQKTYVKYYNKENNPYKKGEDGYKEEKSKLIEIALKYIDKHFEMDYDELKKIYPKEINNIIVEQDMKKYNL